MPIHNTVLHSQATSAQKRKSIILIVDDNDFGRDILRRLLADPAYDLAFAKDGLDALAQAAHLIPDLVLLDVMMPGMDGFQVCEHIRSDPILAEVPVIMLTALDEPDARMRGLEVGADDFISKPFDREELRARVKTIIRLNRYRRLLTERVKFDWVVENADDGYITLNHAGHILDTNAKARVYLNLTDDYQNNTEKQPFLTWVKTLYTCQPVEAWANWPEVAPHKQQRYLVRPESPNAMAFWLRVDILDVGSLGDRSFLPVRLRDVTSQMLLERDMRGFHEMIRHKLRTPLLGILNNLELLIQYAPRMTTDDVVQFSKVAFQSAKRLHQQVEDVMQYVHARNIVGDGSGFELTQLEATIAGIAKTLELVDVTVSIEPRLRASRFPISAQTIELVLAEIIENAKKFHPQQNPTVVIDVTHKGRDKACIQILDDGLTLSPEQLTQVWQPYYQGEKHFTGEVSGMGLGLSLVAMLIWEAGGMYNIANRTDSHGIKVELTLPIEHHSIEMERLRRL